MMLQDNKILMGQIFDIYPHSASWPSNLGCSTFANEFCFLWGVDW